MTLHMKLPIYPPAGDEGLVGVVGVQPHCTHETLIGEQFICVHT